MDVSGHTEGDSRGIAIPRPDAVRESSLIDRLVARVPVGMIVIETADATILAANQAFRAFLAEPYRDRPLCGACLFDVLPTRDEDALIALMRETIATGGPTCRSGMRFASISDPAIAWDVESAPFLADHQRSMLLVLTVIRAREPAELGPEAAHERQQLMERVEEMQLLNDGLIAAIQQKHQFIIAMSHRLRTPLTTVVGFGEMLAAGEVEDPADRQMVYGDIVAAGHVTLGLIEDMIALARLDAGNLRLTRADLSVADILDEARENLDVLAASRQQRVVIEMSARDVRVFADERWTIEIVLKLGANALRFSPTGGTVTLCGRECDPTHIAIDIRDTGVGMKPEDQANVFQAFATENAANTGHGTGLELALVKRLVELQGGTITFESMHGIGTTFTVVLPTSRMADTARLSAASSDGMTNI